jgi:hypothetical protein
VCGKKNHFHQDKLAIVSTNAKFYTECTLFMLTRSVPVYVLLLRPREENINIIVQF